jgi:hypothetical protein
MDGQDGMFVDNPDATSHERFLIQDCPRCGSDHPLLTEALINSDEIDYWGKCPVANQPVLITDGPDGIYDQ